MPIGVTHTLSKYAHEWLKHEQDFELTRAAGTILAGTGNLLTGSVLGKITKGAAVAAEKSGGNTGDGALTLDATTPVLPKAKVGVYAVRCVTAALNGGTFRVTDPDGFVIGDVAVAATFSNQLKFVIADGATDFVAGDGFDVTIAPGSGKYAWHNPTAVNGAEVADAILLTAVDASGVSDAAAVFVTRDAVVAPLNLVWHASLDNQTKKDAALAQLKSKNIDARNIV